MPAASDAAGQRHGLEPQSEEDSTFPLAAASTARSLEMVSMTRRFGRSCWSLGLLTTGLLGTCVLLGSGRLAGRATLRRVDSATATKVGDTHGAVSLYVNLSALDMGQAGKPSEYLLLKGPPDNPNQVAMQVKQGECAVDIVQGTNYLGRAGLQITQAVKVCKPIYNSFGSENYPGNKYVRTACAADASGILSSFSFVATYMSLAASHCSQTVNLPAMCASSATGLIAALAKVANEASTMAANCEGGEVYDPGPPPPVVGSDAVWQNSRRLQPAKKTQEEQQVAAAAQALEDTWKTLHMINETLGASSASLNLTDPAFEKQLEMERDAELATCVIDAAQAATYLAQMGVAFQKAVKGCPLQPTLEDVEGVKTLNDNICAGSVLEIISGFFNAGAFVASAVSHCALGISRQALCAQGAVGLVAAVTELTNFIVVMESSCKLFPPILDNLRKNTHHP